MNEFNLSRDFNEFIFKQGIVGMMIGTIAGFALSNFIKDLKNEFIIKIIRKINILNNVALIASLIEFLIMILILYTSITFVLYPIFSHEIKKEKKEREEDRMWKKELLSEIKNQGIRTVYI